MIRIIAFDADDTLWHNESLFVLSQEKFRNLLLAYQSPDWIDRKLFETEIRNLQHFGYGIKGFTLSMIETAVELSEGRISGREIGMLLDLCKEMLSAPVELLDGVASTIRALAKRHTLILITKGDLFDQESKLARSGLGDCFSHVDVVSEKTSATYQTVISRHGIQPNELLMVGNSMKSDVLPALAAGALAVHIPYHVTWAHEEATAPPESGYTKLEHISSLEQVVQSLEQSKAKSFQIRN
jgi:putative hydrolase of the HAD superfamily